jgi:AICAR transformylase/IMP cyclohydrolase PurH
MPLATAQRCREQDSVPLALLSVSDKTGLIPLAQALVQDHGFQLLSSGGTAKALSEAGIPVTPVSAHTGAPEILGGRVKTLHPRIHGGILARLECSEDRADLEALGIPPIQLVVVNFYPFEQTVAQAGVSLEEAFEQIDIGGPTLARAAAKNYPYVTVLTDPSQYPQYLQLLSGAYGETERLAFRFQCARRAFEQVLAYDRAIVTYLARLELAGPSQSSAAAAEDRFQLQGIQGSVSSGSARRAPAGGIPSSRSCFGQRWLLPLCRQRGDGCPSRDPRHHPAGGSIRDADSIAAANAAGIAMVCTGIRHFLH